MRIKTPLGSMRAPQHEADRVGALSDHELLDSIHEGAFVDPFALQEAINRGIWRDRRPQNDAGHIVRRMLGGE